MSGLFLVLSWERIDRILVFKLVFVYVSLLLLSIWWLIFKIHGVFSETRLIIADRCNNLENVLLDLRDGTKIFYKERRKFPRVNGDIVARIPGEEDLIRVLDISFGGARLRTSRRFKLKDLLEFNIYLPIFPQPIKVRAKVAWTSIVGAQGKDEDYEVGIEFLDMTGFDKERLIETLNVLSTSRQA